MRVVPVSVVLAGLLIGAVPPAFAQNEAAPTAEQKKEAGAKYRDGLQLFDGGNPGEALPLFRQALELTGSPNARLMVARCLRDTGKLAEAHREFKQVIEDASQLEEPKYQKTRESAATELEALEPKVGRLEITIEEPPADLTVELDGEPLDEAARAAPIVVTPGEHEVSARGKDREPITKTVEVGAGATQVIELSFKPPPPKPEPKPEPEPEPEPVKVETSGFSLRTAGYVVAGVGVVSLGVFATTGLMAKSKYDSVYDACGGDRCTDPKYGDDIDSGKSLQTVANITLVVGAVGVLAGSAMILFGGPQESEHPAVSATVLPGGGYVGYSGRF